MLAESVAKVAFTAPVDGYYQVLSEVADYGQRAWVEVVGEGKPAMNLTLTIRPGDNSFSTIPTLLGGTYGQGPVDATGLMECILWLDAGDRCQVIGPKVLRYSFVGRKMPYYGFAAAYR